MTCRPQFQGASVLEVGLKMIEISSNDATRRMIMGLWKREEPRPNRHFMFPCSQGRLRMQQSSTDVDVPKAQED